MSEQLWYTWSANGLGRSNGLRVRAASTHLTEIEGVRVRNFINQIGYALPEATDGFLPPDQTPLCLSFLKTGTPPETLLTQKIYLGLDGIRRPGNFFSHLLTDLPAVPSPVPIGHLPFSAREAINLWRSSLWRDTEAGWPPSKYDLPAIAHGDLLSGVYAGSLNQQSVHQISSLFSLAFEAFLTLGLSPEPKRLYLVGDPDTVATLIWGITHALPRTLTLMQRLTFSTFEANIELDAKPLIVGTCWQPGFIKKGYEQALLDLPADYYKPNNAYGIAIDCANPQHHTPFTPTALVSKYVHFAQGCFNPETTNGTAALTFLQDAAEKREISELPAFLQHYVQFHEMLKEEDVTHILTTLHEKAYTIFQYLDQILDKDRLNEAIDLFSSVGTLQTEIEVVKRDNVQQSLLALIYQQPGWWQRQGKVLLEKLFALSHRLTKAQVSEKERRSQALVVGGRQWQKNQGLDLLGLLQAICSSAQSDPRQLLSDFTDLVGQRILETQALLKEAILPLVTIFVDQLVQALSQDQPNDLSFWNQALEPYLAGPMLWSEVWSALLLSLSTHLRYNGTTKHWWKDSPTKQRLSQYRPQLTSSEQPDLKQAFATFAAALAQELASSIRAENSEATTHWSLLFQLLAPVKQDQESWVTFLKHLGTVPYSHVYQSWYEKDGKTSLGDFAYLARLPESALRPALTAYLHQIAASLQSAILNAQEEAIAFWHTLLLQLAPPEIESAPWLSLLFALRSHITDPGFVHWWKSQGQHTTAQLRRLAEQNKLEASSELIPFTQEAVVQLASCIRDEISFNQHKYDGSIDFFLQILTTAVPKEDTQVWPELLHKLTTDPLQKFVKGDFSERCRWDLRATLLRSWKNVAVLTSQEMLPQIAPWLQISWQELDALLALGLPKNWNKIAIHNTLDGYRVLPPEAAVDIVARSSSLFEEILQELIKSPSYASQAITFFAFLAQYGYPRTLPLLDKLIAACTYHKETSEQLLQAARITRDEQVVTLLEQYCFVLLTSYELPPTMLLLIQRYINNLDLEKLGTDETRNLFERLRNREQTPALRLPTNIQQSVESWYNIAAFLALPKARSRDLRILTRLTPEMQQKLSARLIPQLVTLITLESDLARTLDALRPDDPLPLLKELVTVAGERFGHDDRPSRLVPYIRMVLAETRDLPQEEREIFVNDCFLLLFKDVASDKRDDYLPEKLWPKELAKDWTEAINFLDRLTNLKEALNEPPFIQAIADYYHPAFEKHYIDEQDLEIILLAKRFMAEFQARNGQAILQIHESLKRFYKSPRYTQEQLDLIQAARKPAPVPASSGRLPSMPSLPPAQGNNWASPGQASMSNIAQHPYNQGGNIAIPPSAKPVIIGQQQNPPPPTQQQSTEPPKFVATFGSIKISLHLYENTLEVYRAYTQLLIEQYQRSITELEKSSEPDKKKTITAIQREIKEMTENINNITKFRQLTLQELIDNFFIQEEIKQLGSSRENMQWAQWFNKKTEQDTDMAHAQLQKSVYSRQPSFPLKFTDPHDAQRIKFALEVFIRRQIFDKEFASDKSGLLDLIKERRKSVQIDYQMAKYPKPRGKGW